MNLTIRSLAQVLITAVLTTSRWVQTKLGDISWYRNGQAYVIDGADDSVVRRITVVVEFKEPHVVAPKADPDRPRPNVQVIRG